MASLTSDQARERFARERVARLATVDAAGHPHLVPVVFAVRGDTVVFAVDQKPKRSRHLTRLANIAANPAVVLLADRYDEDWTRLWWSRADGSARVLASATESTASAALLAPLLEKYRRQYGEQPPAGPVVAISVTRWTGWCAQDM
ncbi:TIGR03668 family PPOX class F420-dependent oxidoreductase [Kitasatospora sp. GP82]|uniref:TIGR03668 family PPOX class F420-dependent oxidoreductase n=1 Tax=Kitasatospora sp. GP82 TaxID=3035089 RepID=UPI002474D1E7|nr:TIGR03668 family PPOX class F420-dependent oxidoreductase [Kitasatospora sp. GP82]MDH6126526.1 PPOX class probable F420-dependent enzyme [Kitasatospora sp. GP82]